jgi:acylphosphatase
VQGVYYRASTRDRARSLNLTGYARNLADGRVEVLVAGSAPNVRKLIDWLWHGPPSARVDAVDVVEADIDSVPNDFSSR